MGTLGGEAAFFLGGVGLDLAGAGLGLGAAWEGSAAGEGSDLGMAGAGEGLAGDGLVLYLAMAGEVILASSNAYARRSERD